MKLTNASAEIQAILTSTSSPDKEARSLCFSNLNEDLLAYAPTVEIFKRLNVVLKKTGHVPSMEVLSLDEALSDDAREVLTSDIPPLSDEGDVLHLLEVLNDHKKVRSAYATSKEITGHLAEEKVDVSDLVEIMEEGLLELREDDKSNTLWHCGVGHNTDEIMEDILAGDKSAQIPSGFDAYDKETGGYRRGDLVIEAAQYKGGKSVSKLTSLRHQYRKYRLNVLDVVLEQSKKEEYKRLISAEASIPYSKLHKNEPLTKAERVRFTECWEEWKEHGQDNHCRFTVWAPASVTVSQIELIARPHNYDVIAVDYVNLLSSGDKRTGPIDAGVLSMFNKQLKQMAMRLDCVVIAITQLDENTGNLRYSKSGLEDGNVVITWLRDEQAKVSRMIKKNIVAARSHGNFSWLVREEFDYMRMDNHTDKVYYGDDSDDDDDDDE